MATSARPLLIAGSNPGFKLSSSLFPLLKVAPGKLKKARLVFKRGFTFFCEREEGEQWQDTETITTAILMRATRKTTCAALSPWPT
jgi:hypothetical protein